MKRKKSRTLQDSSKWKGGICGRNKLYLLVKKIIAIYDIAMMVVAVEHINVCIL